MALIIFPSNLSDRRKAFTRKKYIIHLHSVASRMKVSKYVRSVMTNLHFKFSGLSLGYRLCIQSSTSKSGQNRFVIKITGESVFNNSIDLQMFNKQVVHGKGK